MSAIAAHLPGVVVVVAGEVHQDLGVRQLLEGLLPCHAQHLPQRHGERPHVALGRVFPLQGMAGVGYGWVRSWVGMGQELGRGGEGVG